MIKRQIVAAVIVLPCVLFTCDNILAILVGIFYVLALSTIITRTDVGRRFLRALYRDALRLENWLAGQVR